MNEMKFEKIQNVSFAFYPQFYYLLLHSWWGLWQCVVAPSFLTKITGNWVKDLVVVIPGPMLGCFPLHYLCLAQLSQQQYRLLSLIYFRTNARERGQGEFLFLFKKKKVKYVWNTQVIYSNPTKKKDGKMQCRVKLAVRKQILTNKSYLLS